MSSNGAEVSVGIDMDDGQAVENEPEDGEGKNEMGEIIWSMKYEICRSDGKMCKSSSSGAAAGAILSHFPRNLVLFAPLCFYHPKRDVPFKFFDFGRTRTGIVPSYSKSLPDNGSI